MEKTGGIGPGLAHPPEPYENECEVVPAETPGRDRDDGARSRKREGVLLELRERREKGYDECFGNGRTNALRAVLHDTSRVYDPTAPLCPEYAE